MVETLTSFKRDCDKYSASSSVGVLGRNFDLI